MRFERYFALLGLFAIVLQINAVGFDCLLFAVNHRAIVAQECERKVPGCDGKCFLKKQIERSSDDTKATTVLRIASLGGLQYLASSKASLQEPSPSMAALEGTPSIPMRGIVPPVYTPPRS